MRESGVAHDWFDGVLLDRVAFCIRHWISVTGWVMKLFVYDTFHGLS